MPVIIADITLTKTTFPANSPAREFVGGVDVVMSSGPFHGTVVVDGPDAAHFQWDALAQSGGAIFTADTNIPFGDYQITLTATLDMPHGSSPKSVDFVLSAI